MGAKRLSVPLLRRERQIYCIQKRQTVRRNLRNVQVGDMCVIIGVQGKASMFGKDRNKIETRYSLPRQTTSSIYMSINMAVIW